MREIKKGYNLKVILLIIAAAILFNGSGYAETLCEKESLRVPFSNNVKRAGESCILIDNLNKLKEPRPESLDKKGLNFEKRTRRLLEKIIKKTPKESYPAKILYLALRIVQKIRNELPGNLSFTEAKQIFEQLRMSFLILPKNIQDELAGKDIIWINGTGAGEWHVAEPLIKSLSEKYPNYKILLSAPDRGCFKCAKSKFPNMPLIYTPYEIPLLLNRFLGKFRIKVLIMTETAGGIGVNCLRAIKDRGGKVILFNGWFMGQLPGKLLPLARDRAYGDKGEKDFFQLIDVLLAQDKEYAETFISRGAIKSNTIVSGNIKFDTSIMTVSDSEKEKLFEVFNIKKNTPIIVAGSTHPGEPEILLSAYEQLKEVYPDLFLIIAPRNPKDTDAIISKINPRFICAKKTELGNSANDNITSPDIVILDTTGELRSVYSIATAAIVCGSFGDMHGGHNPLEPANFSKPVIFGVNMENFPYITKVLLDNKGALQVRNESELVSSLKILLSDANVRDFYGQNAYNILKANRGALTKSMAEIGKILEPGSIDKAIVSIEAIEPHEYAEYTGILYEIAKEEEKKGEVNTDDDKETAILRKTFSEIAKDLKSAVENPDDTKVWILFVAKDTNENVLGARMLFKPKDKANLGLKIVTGYDVVRENYRRQGIGAELGKAAFKYAAQKGCMAYEAFILNSNEPSLNNLKKLAKELNLSYMDITDTFYPEFERGGKIRSYLLMLKNL